MFKTKIAVVQTISLNSADEIQEALFARRNGSVEEEKPLIGLEMGEKRCLRSERNLCF